MFRVVSSTPSRLKIIFGSGKPSLMTFGNLDAHFGLVVDAVFSDDEPPLSSAMATPTSTTPSRTPPTMSGTGLRLRRSPSGGFAGGGGGAGRRPAGRRGRARDRPLHGHVRPRDRHLADPRHLRQLDLELELGPAHA